MVLACVPAAASNVPEPLSLLGARVSQLDAPVPGCYIILWVSLACLHNTKTFLRLLSSRLERLTPVLFFIHGSHYNITIWLRSSILLEGSSLSLVIPSHSMTLFGWRSEFTGTYLPWESLPKGNSFGQGDNKIGPSGR